MCDYLGLSFVYCTFNKAQNGVYTMTPINGSRRTVPDFINVLHIKQIIMLLVLLETVMIPREIPVFLSCTRSKWYLRYWILNILKYYKKLNYILFFYLIILSDNNVSLRPNTNEKVNY